MTVQLTKDSIDLGIVVKDADAALAFYRDLLGLTPISDSDMPGGLHMWRLSCGTSTIKVISTEREPEGAAPGGGIGAATGYRYWTMSVSNLDEITAACEAAGHKVAIPITTLRPGVRISIVEDPDGNWVEFLGAE